MSRNRQDQAKAPDNRGDPGGRASEELALRVQQGSKSAFTELVNRFGPRLFHYFRQKVGSREDCEDLVQETFVKAYRFIHRYDPARAFDPWLFTIGTRLVVDHFRKRERSPRAPIPHDIAGGSDPFADAERRDERAALWSRTRILPERQRDALWLRYMEEMPIKEVARVLGITRVYVKVLLFRARARLASLCGPSKPTHPRDEGAAVPSDVPLRGAVPVWKGVER